MFYHLIAPFIAQVKYITFRAAGAAFIAFILCLIFGPRIINWLRKKSLTERAEKKDSERLIELHKDKSHTPTLGGLFILLALVIAIMLWARLDNIFIIYSLLTLLGFGILGFFDDWIKMTRPNQLGMTKKFKLIFQFVLGFSLGLGLWYYFKHYSPESTKLYLPLIKKNVELGLLYPFFVTLVIVASSNAVNLTDGLDGLVTGCFVMAALAYAVITYIVGRVDYTSYLDIPYVRGVGELTIVCAALAGAGLGFLWFNAFPAQIFMGNTGSSPLGAVLGLIAVCAKQELVLFVVGAIFVIESLSVILQIFSFQVWHKRIFKIAPLHHHYQFNGLAEPKITVRFWIVAAILALLSLATLKIDIL
jgi:phospho-N-acetylmuramoyl-pentapeptide-transferase